MIRRWGLLVALAACTGAPPPRDRGADVVARWVDAPPPAVAWLGPLRGRLGRGDAAAEVVPAGLGGEPAWTALHDVGVTAVPGDGAARAVVAGRDAAGQGAVELVDVDRRVVRWRVGDAGRVVAVTGDTVVVADAAALHGLDVATGARRWQSPRVFVAATEDRIAVVADAGGTPAVDVWSRRATARSGAGSCCPPASRPAMSARRATGGEVVAATAGSAAALVRVVDGKVCGGSRRRPRRRGDRVDACGDSVLVTVAAAPAIVAIARATGIVTGRVAGARGWWPAPRDRIDVARADGVWRHARDLADDGAFVPELPALAERLRCAATAG